MDMKEMKATALEVFNNSATPTDKDSVLADMFAAGIPFGKLNALYRSVGIDNGFIVDPSVIKENIEAELDELDADTTYDEYSEVESTIDAICENVEGATAAQVTRYFKAWCRDNEIELPKKPKASSGARTGGLGKVTKAMIEYINGTDKPTTQGMYDAVLPHVKGPRNAKDYTNMFFVFALACKFGISGEKAVEGVKAMPKLNMEDTAAPVEADTQTEGDDGFE